MAKPNPTFGQAVEAGAALFASLEQSVTQLQELAARLNLKYSIPEPGNSGGTKRKPVQATAKTRRQWRNQGQYMGLLRSLGPKDRAAAKKVYAKNGIISAIGMATSIRNRKTTNGGRKSASRGKDK